MGLAFGILGPLEVRRDGRVIELPGPKQRVVLAALLLHANEVVSSSRLIDVLWGEHPPATADKALQMHISQLRKQLEPERSGGAAGQVIVTRPAGYAVHLGDEQLDLTRFERAVEEADGAGGARETAEALRAALALWRGSALADLEAYEELRGEIARLNESHLRALEARIDADLELGDHAAVIAELESLVAQHPLRERLRMLLMVALYRSGRQADALAVYRDTRRVLVDELGIEPGRELRELESRILAQDPALDPVRPQPAGERLIGREQELSTLLPIVDGALTGSGAIVLLAGDPGIGKTRLAEALVAHAQERGAAVGVGRCWEAGGAPPYWPWVQAVPRLADLLPAGPDPEGSRFQLFAAIAESLRAAAGERPVALVLDDLHAADLPSLVLLRFVAADVARARVLIVGCYRDTEADPAVTATLADLVREPSVRRVSVEGLTRDGTASLLELTTGTVHQEELVERVHARSEGNPLFAVEIGRALAAQGPDHGEALPIPAGVSEAVDIRLRARSARCREILVLASIFGREFAIEALECASGLAEAELFAVLEEAEAARLIAGVPGTSSRLRFSHMQVRHVLYDGIPAPRRLLLHRQIAEAFEALYARDPEPHLAELAHHFLLAGSRCAEKAIDYSARAGDVAAGLLAYEDAARHYTSALDVLDATASGDPVRRCDLLLSLGEVLSRAGNQQKSKLALRRAAALAEQSGRSDQLTRAALSYGGRLGWERGSTDPALVPVLERALAAIADDDAPARVHLLARLAVARRDDRNDDHRVALTDEALTIARELGDPETLSVAIEGRWIVSGPDAVDEGTALTEQLIALREQLGDSERVFAAHEKRIHVLWYRAERAGVDVELDTLIRLGGELNQPAQRWSLGTWQTMLALMEGRLDEAEQLIADTYAVGLQAAGWNAAVSQRVSLFVLRREQGRLAEVEDMITRSVHEYPTLFRFRCALAHLHSELGRTEAARAAVETLIERDVANEPVDAEWLFAMSVLSDACAFAGSSVAAETLYGILAPYEHLYTQAPLEAAFGSVARALGELATKLERFDGAERHFTTAIEIERRMRARPWLAHAQRGLAQALLGRGARGDRDRAAALLDEARSVFRALNVQSRAAQAVMGDAAD